MAQLKSPQALKGVQYDEASGDYIDYDSQGVEFDEMGNNLSAAPSSGPASAGLAMLQGSVPLNTDDNDPGILGGHGSGNTQTPRDREPDNGQITSTLKQPPPISPPSSEAQLGGTMTPVKPMTPDIMSGSIMPGQMPGGNAFGRPDGSRMAKPRNQMYGKAGGLMGGGMGIPGQESTEDDPSALISMLLQLMK